jgi:hypothetical protein
MSTVRFVPIILTLGAVGASETVAQNLVRSVAPCLHYEPHVVRVTGKLVTEPHFGPPNFGETPDEDQKLDVPVLLLSHAVDVCGDPTSATDQDTVRNVQKVQVVAVHLKLKAFIGQQVSLIGHLYEAFTANHYTKVLIFADSIRVADHANRRL